MSNMTFGEDESDLPIRVVRGGLVDKTPLASGRGRSVGLLDPMSSLSMDVHLIELDAHGTPGSLHEHTKSHNILFVVAGSVQVRTATQTIQLDSQDLIAIPPLTVHSVSVVGDQPARLLEIYLPAPVDFVPADIETANPRKVHFDPPD